MATKIKFRSPFGTARYPHISSADTKGKFADGKFKTKLVMPLGDPATQAFIAEIKAAAEEIHGKSGLKMYIPVTEDEEANEAIFTFKTQYAPAIFDSKGVAIKSGNVGPGSVVRIAGAFVEFDKGISAQFNQVQVRELNGFGDCVFDDVDDGYAYDPSDTETTSSFEGADASDGTSKLDALDI